MKFQRTERGSSLIEVLITILVITIGVMGLGAMQLRTMASNQWQIQHSTAKLLSYQIFERMRANRTAAVSGAYNRALPTGSGSCASASSGNILASNDLTAWLDSVQTQLGDEGCAGVICDLDGVCQVRITWVDDVANTLDMPTQIDSSGAI